MRRVGGGPPMIASIGCFSNMPDVSPLSALAECSSSNMTSTGPEGGRAAVAVGGVVLYRSCVSTLC